MKKFFNFFVSRELWIGVAGSIIATIIISICNSLPITDIKEFFTKDFLVSVLKQPLPLYTVLLGVLGLMIIVYVIRVKRNPAFLKETSMIMGDFIWHWNWSYDKEEKNYDMVDFLPLCPQCGVELRMGYGEHTHSCVNGHQYKVERYFELKSQIKTELRKKYPKEADLISVDLMIG